MSGAILFWLTLPSKETILSCSKKYCHSLNIWPNLKDFPSRKATRFFRFRKITLFWETWRILIWSQSWLLTRWWCFLLCCFSERNLTTLTSVRNFVTEEVSFRVSESRYRPTHNAIGTCGRTTQLTTRTTCRAKYLTRCHLTKSWSNL